MSLHILVTGLDLLSSVPPCTDDPPANQVVASCSIFNNHRRRVFIIRTGAKFPNYLMLLLKCL